MRFLPVAGSTTLSFNSGVCLTPSRLLSSMLSAKRHQRAAAGVEVGAPRCGAAEKLCGGARVRIGRVHLPGERLELRQREVEARHSALAAVSRLPVTSNVAGVNFLVHFSASGVTTMLVVVCRSFSAWRHTSCAVPCEGDVALDDARHPGAPQPRMTPACARETAAPRRDARSRSRCGGTVRPGTALAGA